MRVFVFGGCLTLIKDAALLRKGLALPKGLELPKGFALPKGLAVSKAGELRLEPGVEFPNWSVSRGTGRAVPLGHEVAPKSSIHSYGVPIN